MNLFYLDKDLKVNAESHVDKHVGKMIVEAVQLVCTAFHLQDIEAPYKKTHPNHPSAIWTRNSRDNMEWTIEYATRLNEEFMFRSKHGNPHASSLVLVFVNENKHRLSFPETGFTAFALAMPDEFKESDAIESYRNYYAGGKQHLHKWTKREMPQWLCLRLENLPQPGL